MTLPVKFRIYCDRHRYYYFEVEIYRAKRQMHRAAREFTGHPVHNFAGLCAGARTIDCKRGRARLNGRLGILFLWTKQLGAGVVGHELGHAVLRYSHVKMVPLRKEEDNGRVWVSEDEERFCDALGWMFNGFTRKCYKLGVYK